MQDVKDSGSRSANRVDRFIKTVQAKRKRDPVVDRPPAGSSADPNSLKTSFWFIVESFSDEIPSEGARTVVALNIRLRRG